jgi:hypothetical protein
MSNIEEENSLIINNPETYNENPTLSSKDIDPNLTTSTYHDDNDNKNAYPYPNLNNSLLEQTLTKQPLPIEDKPFNGKYNFDKKVSIYGVKKMECHYFSEIVVTGADAIVSKCNLSAQYYFAFQLYESAEDDKLNLIGSISQGQILSDNWIFVLCFHESGRNNCGAVFISKSWYDINRKQLFETGFFLQNLI